MWINATAENIEKHFPNHREPNYRFLSSNWVFLTYYGNVISNGMFVDSIMYDIDGKFCVLGDELQTEPIIKFMLAEEWVKICHPERQFKLEE